MTSLSGTVRESGNFCLTQQRIQNTTLPLREFQGSEENAILSELIRSSAHPLIRSFIALIAQSQLLIGLKYLAGLRQRITTCVLAGQFSGISFLTAVLAPSWFCS